MSLTTLFDAKAYMGVKSIVNDPEIERLIRAADGVIQKYAGPALVSGTFVERHNGNASEVWLHRYPVTAITSVGSVVNGVSTLSAASTYWVVNAAQGVIRTPYTGTVEVTYVAGLAQPPAEAVDAALVYVSYKYRRAHGGSESYTPAGNDGSIAPPVGVGTIEQQISFALGSYARGPAVG